MDQNNKAICVTFENQKIAVDGNLKTFEELKNFIRQKFSTLPEKIRIYYIDQDNDEITISCDGDLESFEYEENDIEINIKPYSDSDVTDNEEDNNDEDEEDEEEFVSSCCDSDSGEERAIASKQLAEEQVNPQKKEVKDEDNAVNQLESNIKPLEDKINEEVVQEVSVIEVASSGDQMQQHSKNEEDTLAKNEELLADQQNLTSLSNKEENTQSIQCGTNTSPLDMKDQSNQIGISVQDSEQQVIVDQCDQSLQAKVSLCDAQDQTVQIEFTDYSTQIQVESRDNQTQAHIESKDYSFQTQTVELKDNETQIRVESRDNELQADVIQQQDFQSQAYLNNNHCLGSQPFIPIQSAIGVNTDEQNQSSPKNCIQGNQYTSQQYEQKIRHLEENQQKIMNTLIEQERRYEEKFNEIQNRIIHENIDEKIKQMVEVRVNELLPDYSKTNWDNFRRQDRLSRFDRIFQECSPQYNKLALLTDSTQIGSVYDELTTMLIQKLEIARDMYLKELLQNQPHRSSNLHERKNNNSTIVGLQDQLKQEVNKNSIELKENVQEEEEERKEISNSNKDSKNKNGDMKQGDNHHHLVMRKKESTNKYEDDSIVEMRLKDYQERIRKESQSDEENIKKILEEKEREALKLNQEIIANLHKDYPRDVIEKAKEISLLTQSNPNMYLQYVLDNQSLTLNDLMDQVFNPLVIEKYKLQ